ncbi:MAG: hypothetical protein U0W40_11860 [Acidimicrobiia bacterium]
MVAGGTYQGGSTFLRWWPRAMPLFALWILVVGWNHSVQWAAVLVLACVAHERFLPCAFTVTDEGVWMRFPFGKRRFLAKQAITIRLDVVGAVALVGPKRRIGYPLMDRVLYEPGRSSLLYTAFSSLGYRMRAG